MASFDIDSKSSAEGGCELGGGGTGVTSDVLSPKPALGRVSWRTIRSLGRGAGAGSVFTGTATGGEG